MYKLQLGVKIGLKSLRGRMRPLVCWFPGHRLQVPEVLDFCFRRCRCYLAIRRYSCRNLLFEAAPSLRYTRALSRVQYAMGPPSGQILLESTSRPRCLY